MPEFDQYGNLKADQNIPIVSFSTEAVPDKAASAKEGRPIFNQREMVTIIFPADRQRSIVRPAQAEWTKVNGQVVTYADRFPEQYRRFKANEAQVVEGTPLSEAPFLNEAQRATMRALSVYTVEQLASLQGQALKNLGPGGLTLQQQAMAYLNVAAGTANVVALAEENARLKESMADLSAQGADPRIKYVDMSDDKLKDYIRENTGQAPRGNPSRSTLVRMAMEIDGGQKPADGDDE